MRKWLVRVLCALITVAAVRAEGEFRTFTNTEGQAIKAKVIAYDAKSREVTLQRENRRSAKVPIAALSEADRKYILEWDAAKAFCSATQLRISIDDRQLDKKQKKDVGDIRYAGGDVVKNFVKTVTTIESIAYEVELNNRNQAPLKNLRMEYVVYYEQSKMALGKNPVPELLTARGKKEIPELEPASKTVVMTDPVEIYKEDVNPIPQSGGDSRQGGRGKIIGVRIRIYMKMESGSEVMREVSLPEKLSEKDYPWEAAKTE